MRIYIFAIEVSKQWHFLSLYNSDARMFDKQCKNIKYIFAGTAAAAMGRFHQRIDVNTFLEEGGPACRFSSRATQSSSELWGTKCVNASGLSRVGLGRSHGLAYWLRSASGPRMEKSDVRLLRFPSA